MFSFEFATANRIIFGTGKLNELGTYIEGNAKRLLLVCGHSSDAIHRVREILSVLSISFIEFQVHGEPTVDVIRAGIKAAGNCDIVIGLGGGSVLDAGKAIAALVNNPGDVFDYLEVIGKGQPLVKAPLPYIAIPTTAGTGSEVTRNSVIESPEQNVKVSLRSPLMLPHVALVDPELTYRLPPEITASAGLDALTQLIEPFVSVKANPMTARHVKNLDTCVCFLDTSTPKGPNFRTNSVSPSVGSPLRSVTVRLIVFVKDRILDFLSVPVRL